MHLKDHQQTYFVPLQHRHPPPYGGGPFITPLGHNILQKTSWMQFVEVTPKDILLTALGYRFFPLGHH
jgi:hypothetical protein